MPKKGDDESSSKLDAHDGNLLFSIKLLALVNKR
jgi:hypothetical protein